MTEGGDDVQDEGGVVHELRFALLLFILCVDVGKEDCFFQPQIYFLF